MNENVFRSAQADACANMGDWLTYIAEIDYFINPIDTVEFKLFLDLINQARKIYMNYFNSLFDSSKSFFLTLPVLDVSETALQFEEFLNK